MLQDENFDHKTIRVFQLDRVEITTAASLYLDASSVYAASDATIDQAE
jgi:hypothetical protein